MMRSMKVCTLGSLVVCAGSALGFAEETPVVEDIAKIGTADSITYIYYNIASGEGIISIDDQTSPANATPERLLWSTEGVLPCGPTSGEELYFAVDDPGPTSLSTGIAIQETADIALDTVVDCVSLSWVTSHQDVDLDNDGLGDGVEGLGALWGYFEPDDGTPVDSCNRLPIVVFQLSDLPGSLLGDDQVAGFRLELDLGDVGGNDFTFEIGDSDGDCQTAAICNSSVFDSTSGEYGPVALGDRNWDGLPDTDQDGDGLFDFSWRVMFIQPGTADLDGDGQIDGQPAPLDADMIGLMFGMPVGAEFNNDGDWEGEIDYAVPGAGTGAQDRYVIYVGGLDHSRIGARWFGGHDCDQNPDGSPGFTPAAVFQHALYGPGGGVGCGPDLNGDGKLNFFDVSQFLANHQSGGDYNGDGVTDFFDISLFLQDFNAGCP